MIPIIIFKSTLTALAVVLSAIAQPALAGFTQGANGNPTHYNGIPIPPMQTIAEARAATEKRLAAIKAEEAKQAAQAATELAKRDSSRATAPQELFFTGKPYLEETGQYLFLFRHYDPELARWTTPDPSGFPDRANNYLYCNAPFSGFDTYGLAWGNLDFLWHFYFGLGAPVTLSAIGHLDNVKNLSNSEPNGGAFRFGKQIAKRASEIPQPYNGTFSDSFSNTYDFCSIVWAMGGGTLSGTYEGTMTSTPNSNGLGGTYSYSGIGNLFYRDIFTDSLDLIQRMYGNSNAPEVPTWLVNAANLGGTPFVIYGGWHQTYKDGGTYE
jgi:RHS repeat-associated protein